jgi:hypothetical protein
MKRKDIRPPATQRRFGGVWAELDYVCKKINFWLFTKRRRSRAGRYLDRLDQILLKLPENDLAILGWEGRALSCELRQNLGEAIEHRKREIQLIERLYREAEKPNIDARTKAYMLQGRERISLQQRRAHLAALIMMHAAQPKNLMQSSA